MTVLNHEGGGAGSEAGEVERLREALVKELGRTWIAFLDANPDDLTGPEDMPDHAYMTGQQFEDWALEAFDRAAFASAEPVESSAAEPVEFHPKCGAAEAGEPIRAEVERLREALRPFALACTISTADDAEDIDDTIAATRITFGDLRRARAALTASQNGDA